MGGTKERTVKVEENEKIRGKQKIAEREKICPLYLKMIKKKRENCWKMKK